MPVKIARLIGGLLLLIALFYFRLIDIDTLGGTLSHPWMLVIAVALAMTAIPLSGLRWFILLRSQGLDFRFFDTIRMTTIAAFFGTFLPGGAGGDLVRGAYVYRVTQGRRTGALLSIFADRVIGLSAFLLGGVLCTLVRPWSGYGAFEYSLFAAAGAFAAAITLMLCFGQQMARWTNLLFRGRWQRLARVVEDAGIAFGLYAQAWLGLLKAFAVSLVIVALLVAAIVVIATTIDIGGLSAPEYGIAGIYAMIANSLPSTPGGLGVGEGAFASACFALEPLTTGTAYGTIFLVFRCALILSTLPGMLVYVLSPKLCAEYRFQFNVKAGTSTTKAVRTI